MSISTAPSRASRPPLDAAVERVAQRQEHWVRLPLSVKIEYLRALLAGTARTARGQVEAAAQAKGVALDSPRAGEDWISGPYITIRVLRELLTTLEGIRRRGRVIVDPGRVRERDDGQVVVQVFPSSLFDQLLYRLFSAEIWMDPGVTRDTLADNVGGIYVSGRTPPGRVALVLGAGNVASIAPLDVVHKLFFEGQVVVLKLNPVNDYLGPFLEDAFADLIRDGYVQITSGGAEEGAYLCHHESIDEIHITGSAQTHDAIVFGTGREGSQRKARGAPLLAKRVTSELGNVSPVILVPGRWSSSDLRFQAENIATQMTQNGGFNCNAAKVLVTHRDWPQRPAFLRELERVLRSLPARAAYYPGAEERYERFLAAHPQARPEGSREPGFVPPTLAVDLDPDDPDQLAFTTESFCAFSVETSLPGVDVGEFLHRAVGFCNERLQGTLNAEIILHPGSERALGPDLEQAVAALRYGTVGVNHWPALGFALGNTPWGAFPGHTIADIQSGIGSVHNTSLFDRPQKGVIRGPFRVVPRPPWFVTHRNAHRVGERLAYFEADPGFTHLPGIFFDALRG